MLNHITVMGRMTADPEMRTAPNGASVASFTLACERDFKNKDGEKETDFIPVVCWRNTAEFVCNYFGKGRAAVASGRLQIRSYTDKDGNKRKAAEIIADNVYFADSKNDSGNQKSDYTPNLPPQSADNSFVPVDDDGDLPF